MKPLSDFIWGILSPLHAARLLFRHPALLLWSFIPAFIAWLILFYLFGIIGDLVNPWFASTFGTPGNTLSFAIHVIQWLLSLITIVFIAPIVASPFNDFLAEATEPHTTPPLPPIPSERLSARIIRLKLRLVGLDLLKSLTSLILGLALLVLSAVPLLGLLSGMLFALLLTFQFTSYPQTRRGVPLRDGFLFLVKNLAPCLGFGLSFGALFVIPLLSILTLPLAVVGGTLLVARYSLEPGKTYLSRNPLL